MNDEEYNGLTSDYYKSALENEIPMDNDQVAVVLENGNLPRRQKFAKVDGALNRKNYNGLLLGVYGCFDSTNTSKPLK